MKSTGSDLLDDHVGLRASTPLTKVQEPIPEKPISRPSSRPPSRPISPKTENVTEKPLSRPPSRPISPAATKLETPAMSRFETKTESPRNNFTRSSDLFEANDSHRAVARRESFKKSHESTVLGSKVEDPISDPPVTWLDKEKSTELIREKILTGKPKVQKAYETDDKSGVTPRERRNSYDEAVKKSIEVQQSDEEIVEPSKEKPKTNNYGNAKSKEGRPKSSSLWERIKRKEQKEQQMRDRALYEHVQPDFQDLSNEPNYGGEREAYNKRRTLFYSKKGGDAAFIDMVAEVQKETDDRYDVQAYDEPVEYGKDRCKQTLTMKFGRAQRYGGSARNISRDYEESQDYTTVTNAQELRQAVYEDWLARKSAQIRYEQKEKEHLKREQAYLREKEMKDKEMARKATYLQWRKSKKYLIEEQKKKKEEEEKKLMDEKRKKEAAKVKLHHITEAWRGQKPSEEVIKLEKKIVEQKRREKEEKRQRQEEEKKKKELAEAAFKKWQQEKTDHLKKQYIEEKQKMKTMKKEEFEKRLEKDQAAMESFEQWLERKVNWNN